jgi:hypothetical protein
LSKNWWGRLVFGWRKSATRVARGPGGPPYYGVYYGAETGEWFGDYGAETVKRVGDYGAETAKRVGDYGADRKESWRL